MRAQRPALLAVSLGLASILLAPQTARAGVNFDPFARNTEQRKLSPFHTAQAEEAPDEEEPADKPKPEVAAPAKAPTVVQTPAADAPVAPAPEVKPAKPAPPAPGHGPVCSRDEECPVNTICESGACRPFERPIDILLYRKEGRSTSILPFYFAQRGTPGYRVLAPLYFHFWGQESHTRIVAPFYWRVEDYLKQRVVLVIPPYAQTKQPDARSWAVWPFFYLSTKFGWAAPPFLSFKVGDPDHGSAFGMWALLYFWTRTPESKFDLLFPFAISKRSENSAFTWVAPLNFYWRTHDDKSLLALPFFYRNEHKTGGNFVSWLGYASGEGKSTTGSFLWLYWYGRSSSSSYDVLFPMLWSFRSPGANTTVMPPLFHFRSGDTSIGTFALLGWWASDRKAGTSWQLVLPFYFRRSSDHGARTFHLWPTGIYQRDDKEGSRYLTMLAPPLLHWRDKTSETDFDLIYLRYRDIPGDARTTVLGPYYHRDDPQGSTTSLFPLFWYFRDRASGATAQSLLPFYFRRSSPEEKLTAVGVFPLWAYYRSFADGGKSGGLFPLAFFGSRKERSHAILFPLLWHFRSPEATTTALLPLYYHASDKTSRATAVFPLLYFSGAEQGTSYHLQIPLFWHFADQRSGTSTTLAPLYFRYDYRNGYAAGLWPLIFWGGGQKHHFALFPLLWYFRDDAQDRTTTVFANYLHRRYGQETTDALFPLFHYRRGIKPGGQDETSLTLFPLFHYRRDANSMVFASPIAAWWRTRETKVGFLGPYFWYQSPTVAARTIPLLYLDHTQLDTGERTRMWGPYLAFDGPGHQARSLFPLWTRYRSATETGTFVLPTFFHLRRNDGYSLDTLLPLFWLSKSPTAHTTVVGPYFSHHSPAGRSAGLIPLYLSMHSQKSSTTVTPLSLSHRNHETGEHRTFAWLYYQSGDRDKTFRTVFPLWWQWKTAQNSTAVGFPLFWRFVDHQEHKSTTVAGPLYWSHAGSERTRGLLPLFWYSRDEQNGAASNALMPLFYQSRTARSSTFLTVPFGYRRTGDGTWWYALNFFRSNGWRSSFHAFFPLWFHHRDKVADTRTLLVPPLLYYSRTSPERSLTTWLMLFWHRSNITSSSTFGLPLVYDFHAYHQNRLTMVLPLFLRYRNETADETTTVAPLFFRYTSQSERTTVAFPLYWRFWSESRATTVLFPIYFNVRRPNHDSTYIFPNFYYRKGLGSQSGTSHLMIFPFWESEVKRPGDYMWEALLGVVGWERIGRNRFLKLLFIPFELEAAPATQTAWYGKPPKRKNERVARGLDIKAW